MAPSTNYFTQAFTDYKAPIVPLVRKIYILRLALPKTTCNFSLLISQVCSIPKKHEGCKWCRRGGLQISFNNPGSVTGHRFFDKVHKCFCIAPHIEMYLQWPGIEPMTLCSKTDMQFLLNKVGKYCTKSIASASTMWNSSANEPAVKQKSPLYRPISNM